jgi:hypothetical protein
MLCDMISAEWWLNLAEAYSEIHYICRIKCVRWLYRQDASIIVLMVLLLLLLLLLLSFFGGVNIADSSYKEAFPRCSLSYSSLLWFQIRPLCLWVPAWYIRDFGLFSVCPLVKIVPLLLMLSAWTLMYLDPGTFYSIIFYNIIVVVIIIIIIIIKDNSNFFFMELLLVYCYHTDCLVSS